MYLGRLFSKHGSKKIICIAHCLKYSSNLNVILLINNVWENRCFCKWFGDMTYYRSLLTCIHNLIWINWPVYTTKCWWYIIFITVINAEYIVISVHCSCSASMSSLLHEMHLSWLPKTLWKRAIQQVTIQTCNAQTFLLSKAWLSRFCCSRSSAVLFSTASRSVMISSGLFRSSSSLFLERECECLKI